MILNELVKSGPLAKVWLSAHQEKKLTKAQALGVDVGESVEAILSTEDDALPLRSSGPLMLGVVRIYSRKVGYLYDDCREARERISLAFRPGMVDLPEDQVRASKSAITIADSREFDFFDWSWTAPAPTAATAALPAPTGAGLTAAVPTTLPRSREFGAYNFGLPRAPSIYGGSRASPSVSRHGSQDPEGSYLDSNDFSGVDLELGLDMEGEGDISLEMGRDVQAPLSREGSIFAGRKSRESPFGSVPSIPGDITAGGFEPMDLGLDFDNLDQPVPELDRSRRETSGLSTPPPESPRPEAAVTPRTAARLAATPTTATVKPKRLRLVQADDELEIPDEPNRDNSDILGEERYIPSDPDVVRLREIAADPGAHFLPVIRVGGENMIFAGPDGLAPELAELFAFPSNVLRRGRGIEEGEDDGARAKRPRLGPQEEEQGEDVEIGRRQSGAPEPFDLSMGGGLGDDSFAFQQPEEPELEPYFDDPLITPRSTRITREIREPSIAPSRAESIAREIQFGSGGQGDFPLAIFDSRTTAAAAAESQNQSQLSTPSKSATGSQHTTASGFSKNTSMAMGLLRKELDAIEDGERVLSFKKTAEKATKRAASSFFFELLVLGTRDCVKLTQDQSRSQQAAYGDIEIRGKDKLWPAGEGEGVGA